MMISKATRERLTAWWNHEETDRPCILIDRLDDWSAVPDTDDLQKHWTDVDFIIRRQMEIIDRSAFFYEAVPRHYVNFGAVPLGACLGGELSLVDKDTTWNIPFKRNVEEILGLDVTRGNKWWSLIRRIVEASAKRSKGHHFVAYPAFSGIGDILSSVVGIEPFLMELIDHPEEIRKASCHLLEIWVRLFRELGDIIDAAGNPGYVGGWPGVWSPGRSFPIQEDISYMLSKEMFDEFFLPCIDAMVQVMDCPYYHLDGRGAIKFVDSLLGIEKLKVIQWEPGAGYTEVSQWYDLLRYIIGHGKSVQVGAQEEEIEPLIRAVGSKGLLITTGYSETLAEKYASR